MIYSKIIGTGSYLPKQIVTNDDLSKIVDTNDEWISTRTGIKQRHVAEENELTSDLAYNAATDALKSAGINAEDLDLIIMATTTPDDSFPSTAAKIQGKLKAVNAAAFDMQAVCTGFIYAMSTADNFIKSGKYKNVLVIGAETISKILDWTDRNTCVLFGDGAGAVVLKAIESDKPNGILGYDLKTDGSHYEILKTTGGMVDVKAPRFITMAGKEVFKIAVNKMPEISNHVIENANLTHADIDWFVPHQANIRIIDASLKKLDLTKEKTVVTVDQHANTSAASIPLALDSAVKSGKIKEGDNILMTAMGGGFTWGAIVVKY